MALSVLSALLTFCSGMLCWILCTRWLSVVTAIPDGPAALQCPEDGDNCFAIVHLRVLPQAWLWSL